MDEEKQVVPSAGTDIAVGGSQQLGFSGDIGQEDLIIPRVKLFQGNPTEAEQYPNAKGGQILNSLTAETLGGLFVPVFQTFEWIKFNARNSKDPDFDPSYEPGAMIWRTTDPKDDRVAGDPDAWKHKTIKFLCYFEGQPMPLILTFAKTSYAAGKKLLSLAKFSGLSMFMRKYKLTSKKEEKEGNLYYVFLVEPAGIPTEQELVTVKSWYNEFLGKQLKEHEEQAGAQKDPDWKE